MSRFANPAKLLRSEYAVALITVLLVQLAAVALRALGVVEPVELLAFDQLLRWRPDPQSAGARIVVVEYTEDDIQDQSVGYPLNDGALTAVLERILAGGPRAVGVDFFRDILIAPGSEDLEALLQSDGRIVMIHQAETEDTIAIPPPRVLSGTQQIGLADLTTDPDDTVRRGILYQDDEEAGALLSLALQTSLFYLGHENVGLGLDPADESRLMLGDTPLPRFDGDDGGYAGADDAGYQMLIDWEGRRPFRGPSMLEVLSPEFDTEVFRDKIVFVGATASTHADLRNVPFGWWPGIFVHAHVASQLLRYGLGEDEPLRATQEVHDALWIGLWSFLGAGLALLRRPIGVSAALLVAGLGAIWGVASASMLADFWLPPATPSLAWLASASAVSVVLTSREAAARAALMTLFSRHLSKDVAEELWRQRDEFLDGGRPKPRRAVVSVLFLDIKSFTPVAEKLDPLEVVDWLNELMGAMGEQPERFGGFIEDFFGDGLLADFGIPLPRHSEAEYDRDADAAVRCALAMEEALGRLNESWESRGLPTGRLRIGVHTGEAIVGSVGSQQRLKYTVLGDTVNTAARIEALDDSGHDFTRRPVRILISESTRARIGDAFETRDAGEFALKGKQQMVRIYEVVGLAARAVC